MGNPYGRLVKINTLLLGCFEFLIGSSFREYAL